MAGNLFYMPRQIAIDGGAVVPGAKLSFFQTGTSTPQDTYQDVDLATAHANPVVADAEGVFDPIYFDPSFGDYRVKLTDSDDVLIWQEDDVPASQSGQSLTLQAAAPFIDLIETDAAANNTSWRLQVNSEQLLLRLANDDLDSFQTILTLDRTANVADALALAITAITNNGNTMAEITKGSFTPTFTGFSADPEDAVVYWSKVGSHVQVLLSFGTGTSNLTVFTITNWPAAIQPDRDIQIPVGGLVDNGTEFSGGAIVLNASAVASFYTDFAFSLWTGSGNKGISNSSLKSMFSYSMDIV